MTKIVRTNNSELKSDKGSLSKMTKNIAKSRQGSKNFSKVAHKMVLMNSLITERNAKIETAITAVELVIAELDNTSATAQNQTQNQVQNQTQNQTNQTQSQIQNRTQNNAQSQTQNRQPISDNQTYGQAAQQNNAQGQNGAPSLSGNRNTGYSGVSNTQNMSSQNPVYPTEGNNRANNGSRGVSPMHSPSAGLISA